MATNTRIQWVLSPSELAICCLRRTTPIPFNTHRVWDNCGNPMFVLPYPCASSISYKGIDYHLLCECSIHALIRKTPAHGGRAEPSIWSQWLCWRGWPRRWQLEQGWTWLWQRQGEINLKRICLYFTVLLYLAVCLLQLCLLLKFPFKTENGEKKAHEHVPLIEGHSISSNMFWPTSAFS